MGAAVVQRAEIEVTVANACGYHAALFRPNSQNPPNRGGEGTVHVIVGREAVAEFDGFEAGRGFEDAGDELLVFRRFDAAGAVNEDATGFEDAEAVFEELRLCLHLGGDVIELQTPAHIDAAAHDAGVGAGHVEQDAVEAGLGEGGDLRV